MGGRNPVDSAPDLAPVRRRAPPRLGIVSTVQFHHLAAFFVLYYIHAGNVVAVAQPHLAAGPQTEKFPRRIFAEIIALDVEFARKGHQPRPHTLILWIVHCLQLFDLIFRIIVYDHFERLQNPQYPGRPLVQVFANAVLEQGHIHQIIALRHADFVAETAKGRSGIAAPAQAR